VEKRAVNGFSVWNRSGEKGGHRGDSGECNPHATFWLRVMGKKPQKFDSSLHRTWGGGRWKPLLEKKFT